MPDKLVSTFEKRWLFPVQTDVVSVQKMLEQSHGKHTDFSEVYFQHVQSDSWSLEESKVKSVSSNLSAGAGIRVVAGDKTGFCHTSRFDQKALADALGVARSIEHYFQSDNLAIALPIDTPLVQRVYGDDSPLAETNEQGVVTMLQELDAYARSRHPAIEFVELTLARQYEQVLVMSSDGVIAADYRPLFRCNVRVIVTRGERRESGYSGAGGRQKIDQKAIEQQFRQVIHSAVDEALINLEAQPVQAGTMPVVLGSGWPGVLLHEAVGHGLEADFNRKGTSIFADRIGEQVASSGCTVVDNGAMIERRGSLQIDDEGTPGAENILIEDGVLTNYMQDRINARLMNRPVTGNGRRQSYAHLPMPRMTNTYMLAGERSRDEIIASVDDGIYAENFGGGQVDITSGNFVFNASLAYKIEKGKIMHPVKGVSLIGNGPDVMQKVSMIGNDLALDPGVGVCGKDGQSVPVGVGQPTLKVDTLVVGGTG